MWWKAGNALLPLDQLGTLEPLVGQVVSPVEPAESRPQPVWPPHFALTDH